MTHRTALLRLARYLTIACPADQNFVVQQVMSNQLVLQSSAGTADQWEGGLCMVTSGDALNERIPIATNSANTVYLATGFDNVLTPHEGDTVTLSGGPLQQAVIELFQPDAITEETAAGQNYIITLNTPGLKIEQKTLGPDSKTRGMNTVRRYYEFNLALETPDITGNSVSEAFEAKMALPVLVEQVLARIHWFRSQGGQGFSGEGPIEVMTGIFEREGGPVVHLAGINFVARYGK